MCADYTLAATVIPAGAERRAKAKQRAGRRMPQAV
jgi:hypothetical protein